MKILAFLISFFLSAASFLYFFPISREKQITHIVNVKVTDKITFVDKTSICGCPSYFVQYSLAGKNVQDEVKREKYEAVNIGDTMGVKVVTMTYQVDADFGPAIVIFTISGLILLVCVIVDLIFDKVRNTCTRYRIYQVASEHYCVQRYVLGMWETLDNFNTAESAEKNLAEWLTKQKTRRHQSRYIKNINVDFSAS